MTDPPSILMGSAMYIAIGCSSIADANGNLQFYTDGGTIWNAAHQVMANGTGLFGNETGSQTCLIVKKPQSSSIYFVFTVEGLAGPTGLSYSVVDMSLAAGLGSVTVKNVPLFPFPCSSKIAGAYHCNGQDVWVVVHEWGNTNFRSYLVTSVGIAAAAVISPVGSIHNTHPFGTIKISTAGSKLAVVNGINVSGHIQVFDFSNTTGVVSNPITVLPAGGLGQKHACEFSPDNSFLYATALQKIFQWNVCAGDSTAVAASVYTITHPAAGPGFRSMQLAINEKMYVAVTGPTAICVINEPNKKGFAMNMVYDGQSVAPNQSNNGLPNHFLRYRHKLSAFSFSLESGVACRAVSFTSAPMPTVSCAASNYAVNSTKWDFGDPASGTENTSTASNPLHIYRVSGSYTVMQIFYYNCGSDTLKQTVTVPPPDLSVTAFPGCENTGGSATASASGGSGSYSYTWFPSAATGSATGGLGSGHHTVTVFDQGLGCAAQATVALVNFTVPAVSPQPALINLCAGGSSVISAGGAAPGYSWQPQGGLNVGLDGQATVSSPVSQLYTITANNGSCVADGTLHVNVLPLPSPSIQSGQSAGCAGGTISLSALGGSQFTWYLPGAAATHGPAIEALLPEGPTAEFTLIATDPNGCSNSAFLSIPVKPAPSGDLAGFKYSACAPF